MCPRDCVGHGVDGGVTAMRFCPECGAERAGADTYCRECGRKLGESEAAAETDALVPDSSPGSTVSSVQSESAAPSTRPVQTEDRLPLPAAPISPERSEQASREAPVDHWAPRPWSLRRWPIAAAGVVVLGVGVAVALLVSGGSGHGPRAGSQLKLASVSSQSSRTQAASEEPSAAGEAQQEDGAGDTGTVTGSGAGGSTAASSTSTSTSTSQAKSAAVPPTAGTPLGALENYWTDIRSHDFAGAYRYLVPGSIEKTEAQFIAEETGEHIGAIQLHGTVAARAGSSATVAISSLVTHDSTYGCRRWSGSYEMQESDGHWLIARADLSPQSCG